MTNKSESYLIDELNLPNRVKTALLYFGEINTVDSLCELTVRDLKRIPHIGNLSVEQIVVALKDIGRKLPGSDPYIKKEPGLEKQMKHLTKREYYAAMAMQGFIMTGSYDLDQINMLAEESTKVADALIEELEK